MRRPEELPVSCRGIFHACHTVAILRIWHHNSSNFWDLDDRPLRHCLKQKSTTKAGPTPQEVVPEGRRLPPRLRRHLPLKAPATSNALG